jgi:hypothetical protein
MNSIQRNRLAELLAVWVRLHPEPDSPELAFAGRTYTPEEILEEVRSGTEFGEDLGNFLYESARETNVQVEEFIRRAIAANTEGSR